ncbi:unnamed protein product [Cuscuta epithymum]|uniref:Ubiquitin-like protease family profile domain-containing protein n=1 Tax=Cuscuta epithymum TaxID=186058 RepID=A0AAV0D9T2_9ASTE|nr:unnamed protein product [Cuscuta epithymum]
MFEKNLILLAYNEGYHWILFVICPKVDKGYIFNSLPSSSNFVIQDDLTMMYRVASTQKGRGKSIKWHNVKVWNSRSEPYTTEEFNDIRNAWARFFVDEVMNM